MNGLCYWEIPSKDVAKSSAFYAKLFGWKMEPSTGDYMMFQVKGGLGGGIQRVKRAQVTVDGAVVGRIGAGITHSETVSLARTDDLTRGSYRLRLDVQKPADFSRFVLFQIGAAPVIPDASAGFIGELSLLPTHATTTRLLVYPAVQLSRLSSVVPVFAATDLPAILR